MAENETYNVITRLLVDGGQANNAFTNLGGRVQAFGRAVRGSNSLLRGMIGSAVAFGATYIGFRAVTNAVMSFGRSSMEASAGLEGMQTALATVLASVERMPFAQAQQEAQGLFRTINDLAVTSPATGQELFRIFQGTVGPLRNAGIEMSRITDLSKNAAAAATALGIDFAQATRDMTLMATGRAGLDVKSFALLQAMGLVTETTKEWNEMNPTARAERLMEVMGQMGGESAEAYARTWIGLSSTFRGIMEQFQRVFATATFERLKGVLARVNDFLLQYRANFERVLSMLGDRLGNVFGAALGRFERFSVGMVTHLDAVAVAIDAFIVKWTQISPILAEFSKAMIAFTVVRAVFGPLITGIGALISAIGSISSLLGVGSAAAAAGGAGAAAGGAAVPGLAAILAPFAPVAAAFAAVGAAVVAVVIAFEFFRDKFTAMIEPLRETWTGVWNDVVEILGGVWALVEPIFLALGAILGGAVIGAFRVLGGVLRVLMIPLRLIGRLFRWLGETVLRPIGEILGLFALAITDVIGKLGDFFNWLASYIPGIGGDGESIVSSGPMQQLLQDIRDAWNGNDAPGPDQSGEGGQDATGQAPEARGGTHVDMRGSRITVNQEFREANPDRVWVQMRDALEREATNRTQSGFVSALAR